MRDAALGRRAGLLIPLFSCPGTSSWGIGEIGDLVALTGWLAAGGQRALQLLPINEMAADQHSPYSAMSAMAIDPIYISLALVPDFRVTCPEARFSANFTRLGFHPGFGLTVTLPELIGRANASLMFYTSRRVKGDDAHRMGLADVLVPLAQVRTAAQELAREIAGCAPLGVVATRATMRQGFADHIAAATKHELNEQTRLRRTQDFKEGIQASAERRDPQFRGA